MTLGEWLTTYLQALPTTIRSTPNDPRLINAARLAQHNGWAPRQAAAQVAARNYQGATNPTLLAITQLETATAQPPPAPAPRRHDNEAACPWPTCHCPHTDCFKGWVDTIPTHTQRGVTYTATAPCPTCRPELARRLAAIPPPGLRSQADLTYLRSRDE